MIDGAVTEMLTDRIRTAQAVAARARGVAWVTLVCQGVAGGC